MAHKTKDTFDPSERRRQKAPTNRQWIIREFNIKRLLDFGDHIEPGNRLLSIGSGEAELESKFLADKFEEIHTLEAHADRAQTAREKGLSSTIGAAPPLPFEDAAFDTIVGAGLIEHISDREAFLKEVHRCLEPGGRFYLTAPIEVGFAGFIRFLGKNFVYPDRSDTPDGWRRYFDYTLDEFRATVPRGKNDGSHRYYNYKHTLEDLHDIFPNVTVKGWPISHSTQMSMILFISAQK